MLGLYMNARNFVTSRLTREEKGATAVEYGIMVALIAVAVVAAVSLLGPMITELFGSAAETVNNEVTNDISVPTPAP
jgi:pilus assembly protein Flp/PilA